MFTRETLTKLHDLTAKVRESKELTSELVRTAQDRFNHRTHKIMRDGKMQDIREKELWVELFHLGHVSEAGKILREAHPEVFEASDKQSKLADELKKFCMLELAINMEAMTISDYLRLTEGMFGLLLEENLQKATGPKE